jgi:hypothetical protein
MGGDCAALATYTNATNISNAGGLATIRASEIGCDVGRGPDCRNLGINSC